MTITDWQKVCQFTAETNDMDIHSRPIPLSKNQVIFIIRMVMSELHELACTVTKDEKESVELMEQCLLNIDKCKKYDYLDEVDLVASQADSMVDAYYYMLNIAAKHGMDLSGLFDVVHQANMDKRDKVTGKFIKRPSDGKVIKPADWKEPDVYGFFKSKMD